MPTVSTAYDSTSDITTTTSTVGKQDAINLYAMFYVKKKDLLFPLMQKYVPGSPIKRMNHGEAASLYVKLLKTNVKFKEEVSALMKKVKFKGADGDSLNVVGLEAILGGVLNTAGSISANQVEKQKQETLLYESILKEQGSSDTTKILIASGVALAFVVIGVILVVKMKKK